MAAPAPGGPSLPRSAAVPWLPVAARPRLPPPRATAPPRLPLLLPAPAAPAELPPRLLEAAERERPAATAARCAAEMQRQRGHRTTCATVFEYAYAHDDALVQPSLVAACPSDEKAA